MALKDLMNNYFYGKQGKGDFTVADLPQNRRQLFGAVLKVRWTQMVGLNLLYLIIWIPAVVWTALNLARIYTELLADAGSAVDVSGIVMTWLMLLAPCIAITGPFNAGATFVLRNWARDQHSFMLSDFWDAVKANWKQALGVSCISGALPFFVYVAVYFYSAQMSRFPAFIVPIALVILVGVLWSLSTMIMYDLLITYELRFRDVIRNALLLTVGKLPYALLFKAITLVVPVAVILVWEFAPGALGYAGLAASILCVVILPAFNKLVTVSYANWLCETYLNTRIEGAPTNIGLRPENWDDVEYRPEDDED